MGIINAATKWIFFFLFVFSPVIYNWVKYDSISTINEIAIPFPALSVPAGWKVEEVESYKLPPGQTYKSEDVLKSSSGTIYMIAGSRDLFYENKEGKRAGSSFGFLEEEKKFDKNELITATFQNIKENPKRVVYKVREYTNPFWVGGGWAWYVFSFFFYLDGIMDLS